MRKTEEEILRDAMDRSSFQFLYTQFPALYSGIITAMQTFAQQDKWIKVEVGLPEEGEVVEVYNAHGAQVIAKFIKGAFYMHGQLICRVTYWKPTTPPPNSTPST